MDFKRLHNFRDLGGYRAADGRRVQWGMLYRSDSLAKLEYGSTDWNSFAALGIRTVIDLRYPSEVLEAGRVPDYEGLAYHNHSIEHRPSDQAAQDPETDPVDYLGRHYGHIVEDGVEELRGVLAAILEADSAPLVFHCVSGKDRTGIVAALVLSLLGVSDEDIAEDFALTSLATEHFVAEFHTTHPDRELRWPAYGTAPKELMRRFLADIARDYGTMRGYAEVRLGIDGEAVDALRERFLATPQ